MPRVKALDVPRSPLEVSGHLHPTETSWILHFKWPTNPIPVNGSRGHWGTHSKKSRTIRTQVGYSARMAKIPALDRIEARLVWWVGDAGRRDPANLAALEKPMFDALVDAGIVPDDNPTYMETPRGEIHHWRDSEGLLTGPGFTFHIHALDTAAEF